MTVSGRVMTTRVRVLGVRHLVTISGPRDERISQIARLQRGRVARRQLRAAGIPDATINRLAARGQLHREHAGVFAAGHPGEGPLTRETAALLACGPGALLSHLTAARLLKLVPERTGPVEVTVVDRNPTRPRGVKVHRTQRLHRSDLRFKERLPLTSPARTLLDIAEELPERETERALDEGLATNIVRIGEIRDAIARNPGRHGAAVLTALLDQRTGSTISRSEAEEQMSKLIRAANLPRPEMNYPLLGFNADFAWVEHRVVLEVDGYPFHSTKTAFERDRRKDAALKGAGWDVVRISRNQVFHDSYAVIALVAMAIARAQTCARSGAA
jgi:very-short-patch-repair endonuclease